MTPVGVASCSAWQQRGGACSSPGAAAQAPAPRAAAAAPVASCMGPTARLGGREQPRRHPAPPPGAWVALRADVGSGAARKAHGVGVMRPVACWRTVAAGSRAAQPARLRVRAQSTIALGSEGDSGRPVGEDDGHSSILEAMFNKKYDGEIWDVAVPALCGMLLDPIMGAISSGEQ
eukprot:189838-Chlamydomonas_euryale.AAC.3